MFDEIHLVHLVSPYWFAENVSVGRPDLVFRVSSLRITIGRRQFCVGRKRKETQGMRGTGPEFFQ
ncbi:MAG: hypothetical protein NVSMB26_17270 [Beijerinckiaceae bacterium]